MQVMKDYSGIFTKHCGSTYWTLQPSARILMYRAYIHCRGMSSGA
jgi:hypothetical protein